MIKTCDQPVETFCIVLPSAIFPFFLSSKKEMKKVRCQIFLCYILQMQTYKNPKQTQWFFCLKKSIINHAPVSLSKSDKIARSDLRSSSIGEVVRRFTTLTSDVKVSINLLYPSRSSVVQEDARQR